MTLTYIQTDAPSCVMFPSRFEEVAPWVSAFDPELRPYLYWLGGLLVKTAGDPSTIENLAGVWTEVGRGMAWKRDQLAQAQKSESYWEGPAGSAARARFAALEKATAEKEAQFTQASQTLQDAAAALRFARNQAEELTAWFLRAAGTSPPLVMVMGTVNDNERIAWRQRVAELFSEVRSRGLKVIEALDWRLGQDSSVLRRLMPALPSSEPQRAEVRQSLESMAALGDSMTRDTSHWRADDDVRSWVEGDRSPGELAMIPPADRVRAVETLLSGVVTEADVSAAEKLLAAVMPGDDAAAVRQGLTGATVIPLQRSYQARLDAAIARLDAPSAGGVAPPTPRT